MPDDANIQLLLAKLPTDSLARKLVEPFATLSLDEAMKASQTALTAVKDAHLKEDADGPPEAT